MSRAAQSPFSRPAPQRAPGTLRLAVGLVAVCGLMLAILSYQRTVQTWQYSSTKKSASAPSAAATTTNPPPPPPLESASRISPQSKRKSTDALPRKSKPSLHSDPTRTPWGVNATLHGPPPAIVLFAPHKTASTFFTTLLHDLSRLLGLCWYSDNVGFTYSPPDNSKCGSPSCGHRAEQQKAFQVGDGGWGDCSGFAGTQILIASMCIQEQQPQEKQQQQVVSESGATRAAAAAGDEEASIRPFYGIDNGDNQTEYPWVVDDWLEDGMKGWIAEEEAAEEEQEQGLASCGIPPPISATNGVAWGALRLPAGMRRALTTLGTPPWHWYLILHQRHPGDTLVSEYHSFGWTHPPPPNASPEQKRRHAERQAVIRNTSAAKYVSDHLEDLRSKYVPYMEVLDALKQQKLQRGGGSAAADAPAALPALDTTHLSIIRSKYEELVTDFAKWLDTLLTALATSYTRATLDIVRAALLEKHKRSFDPNGKHKKSVKPGRYDAEVLPAAATEHKKRHAAWWAPLGYA